MKRAAVALHDLTSRITGAIGMEGAFLLLGTGLLSVGAERWAPGGAFVVTGAVALLVGIALVVPRKER